jgi:hypothetical protein
MNNARICRIHRIKTHQKLQINSKIRIRTNNLKPLITKINFNLPKTNRAKLQHRMKTIL